MGKTLRVLFILSLALCLPGLNNCAARKGVPPAPPQQKFVYTLESHQIAEEIRKTKMALQQANDVPLRCVLLLDLA